MTETLPVYSHVPPHIINSASLDSDSGEEMLRVWASVIGSGSDATFNTTPFVFPFRIYEPSYVAKVYTYNGTVVSGNWDVGIYHAGDGSSQTVYRAYSTGAVAQAGTSVLQFYAVTGWFLPVGQYYGACSASGSTGRYMISTAPVTSGDIAGMAQGSGASHPLASSITLVKPSTNRLGSHFGFVMSPNAAYA